MDGEPGDKSPGYYRVSLRDEGKPVFCCYIFCGNQNGLPAAMLLVHLRTRAGHGFDLV